MYCIDENSVLYFHLAVVKRFEPKIEDGTYFLYSVKNGKHWKGNVPTKFILDMFDGKVARTKKNRTDGEKDFGVQIDSLSDIIAFGILPACIGYSLITPLQGKWQYNVFIVMIFVYVLFGLVRLAYFNTLENERDRSDDKTVKEYLGLPITNAALLLPVIYVLKFVVNAEPFIYIYMGSLVLLSLLYVVKFKLKKPNKYYAIFMSIFGVLLIAGLVVLLLLK